MTTRRNYKLNISNLQSMDKGCFIFLESKLAILEFHAFAFILFALTHSVVRYQYAHHIAFMCMPYPVGGFNPIQQYESNWILFPNTKGEG